MQARAAYIRSLGTTSILVAAALLMLGLVGALVGFHGWPEGAVGETVPSVPAQPVPQRIQTLVRAVRTPVLARKARLVGDRGATAGLVKQVPVSSSQPIGYPVAVVPGEVAPAAPAPHASAEARPSPAIAAGPIPPTDPQAIQVLVGQLLGSAPPPPAADLLPQPQAGEPFAIALPLAGTGVSVPPAHAR
jgi:hypothetical protein